MATVEKKIWPKLFGEIKSGKKKFEFRLADFDVAEGDTLVLREWDPDTKAYTGRTLEKNVSFLKHLTLDEFGQKKELEEHGFYIIQFD